MARYADAIEWIARNEDISDITDRGDDPILSINMQMVADIWGKETDRVRLDIINRAKLIAIRETR